MCLQCACEWLDAIRALLNHTDAGEGGYYDYLPGDAPHLNPGEGADKDPAYYFTPLVAGPSAKSVDPTARLSWSSFAMSFFHLIGLLAVSIGACCSPFCRLPGRLPFFIKA